MVSHGTGRGRGTVRRAIPHTPCSSVVRRQCCQNARWARSATKRAPTRDRSELIDLAVHDKICLGYSCMFALHDVVNSDNADWCRDTLTRNLTFWRWRSPLHQSASPLLTVIFRCSIPCAGSGRERHVAMCQYLGFGNRTS